MNRNLFATALLLLVAGLIAPASAQDLTGIKCPVMGSRGASAKHSVDYLDGKIYLCCPRCLQKFSDANDKYSTKANHQLVVTGQYVQTRCPSGANIENSNHKLKVAGVEVVFCDEEEMKKVADAANDELKIRQVFASTAFEKAFNKKSPIDISKAKCVLMPKRAAKEKFSVNYEGGTLYFCCKGCVNKFAQKKNDEQVIAKANEQLFATGQYHQTVCPVGGQELSDVNYVELNGNRIRVCCRQCVGTLTDLDSDNARMKKIFNKDNFAKSFAPAK